MAHAERARSADAVVFVFPVWWFSVPAVLKGYIDRVWNHGLFYGGGRTPGISIARWVGLAGETEAWFKKRDYDKMLEHYLNVGIAGYCGIEDTRVELFYETLSETDDVDAYVDSLRARARAVAGQVMTSL